MLKKLLFLFCLIPTLVFADAGGGAGISVRQESQHPLRHNATRILPGNLDITGYDLTVDDVTATGTVSGLVIVQAGTPVIVFPQADYLVGTANGSLSAEIVVGTSPSGDLGNTWADISVDDDSHAHTTTTLSGIDISADTNLTAGDDITLTDDDLDVDSTVTRDTEWDTEAEVQTAWGSVNVLLETEIDASSELLAIMDDETGTGALTFATSPTFTTDITTPKISSVGNLTIDAVNAGATSTVYVLNSGAGQVANLDVEGDLTVTDISVVTGGTLQLGADGIDGLLKIYSEQGATDYITSIYTNTAMTSAASFYLPADEPAGTYLLNMTTGGVIGYDSSTYLTTEVDGSITNELPIAGNLIDISGSPASTVDVDLTEAESVTWGAGAAATIVHTYNVSGTDTTMTMGSAATTFSGTVAASNLSGSNTGDNTVATTGDSATSFFSSGTLEVAIGGTGTTTSTGTGSVMLGTSPTITTSLIMSDGATIGQAAGPLVAFDDTLNYLEITGCNVGIGTTSPTLRLDLVASTAIGFAGTAILSDSAGTMTLSNVDGIDATTETTLEAAIDTLGSFAEGGLADSTVVSADIKNAEIVSADLSGTAGITLAQTAMTAGRSLTISTNDVVADAETYTFTKCLYFETPVATDDFKSIWLAKSAATLTSIWAESDQTVTFMLQVDDGSPADVDSVDLAPAAGTAEDTSLDGDTTLAAGDRLDLAVTSVANTPTWCSICFTGTYDD